MRELRGELRLAAKAMHGVLVARDFRVEHLERDLAREREIAHAPHGAEGSGAEAADHFVVLAGGPAEARLFALARSAHRACIEPLVNIDVWLPTARSSSRSIAAIEWKRSAGSRLSARASTFATETGMSGRTSVSGGRSRGGYSRVNAAKAVAASCH